MRNKEGFFQLGIQLQGVVHFFQTVFIRQFLEGQRIPISDINHYSVYSIIQLISITAMRKSQ